MYEQYTDNIIDKLNVRSAGRDEPALRLGLSTLFERINFSLTNLSPASVLVVNNFSDPMPGKFSISNYQQYPDIDWLKAAQENLQWLFQNAEKPELGFIPSYANAIIFSDQAELLACLSIDIAQGVARQRWWWKMFLKQIDLIDGISQQLSVVLSENIEYLPAVINKLDSWSYISTVIENITRADALILYQQLLHQYELYDLAETLVDNNQYDSEVDPVTGEINHNQQPLTNFNKLLTKNNGSIVDSIPTELPDQYSVSEYTDTTSSIWFLLPLQKIIYQWTGKTVNLSGLSKDQALLVCFGLILNIKPWVTSNPKFKEQIIRVYKGKDLGFEISEQDNRVPITNNKSKSVTHQVDPYKEKYNLSKIDNKDDTQNLIRSKVDTLKLISIDADNFVENDSESTVKDSISSKSITTQDLSNNKSNTGEIVQEPILLDEDSSDNLETVLKEDGITTELGGILYLLNLLVWLGLPKCFESDWHLASQLSPWALLELIARSVLLSRSINDINNDVIWSVLAELDGRTPDEPVVASFTGADDYKLPQTWFENINNQQETYRYSSAKGRFRLWAASGYLLVDLPRNNSSAFNQANNALQTYLGKDRNALLAKSAHARAPLFNTTCLDDLQPSPELKRWLSFTMPFIQCRLEMAIDGGINTLLQCRGKLYVTSSHIDFYTSLENISMAARIAGLDSNPGWMPGIGRVVLFHFE